MKRITLIIISTVLLTGCPARYRVEIRTVPEGANVEVTARNGDVAQPTRLLDKTPAQYTFRFKRPSDSFDITVSKNEYDDTTEELTADHARGLRMEDGVRVLPITMKRSSFVDMDKPEVVIDPNVGLTVRYRSVRAFREDIERQGVPVSSVVKLSKGLSFGGLTISPDGRRLAFGVNETGEDQTGQKVEFSNIRSVSNEGGGITQMTTGRWLDIDPAFGANGNYLYFASNRLRTKGLDLLRIGANTTGGGVGVVHRQIDGWAQYPTEAKDGLIAFSYLPQYAQNTGISHVWTLGGSNQYPTQVREGKQPAVAPDGTKVVYVGPDDKIWTISTQAAAPVQLTTDPETTESEPAWSPGGDYIVYVSNEGRDNTGKRNNDIWIMRADGTGSRQLMTNGSDDISPVIDPHQQWIYFVSNRGVRWGIWRMPWPTGLAD